MSLFKSFVFPKTYSFEALFSNNSIEELSILIWLKALITAFFAVIEGELEFTLVSKFFTN